MQIKWNPATSLRAEIVLPSSKSISNRALIINALSGGGGALENVSECDDTRVMLRALKENPSTVDIMAAGTAMRFLTAYYAATPGSDKVMTGTARMQQRPIRVLVDALRRMGAQVDYVKEEGYPPLHVRGKALECQEVALQGNVSSQYISALLMIGPLMKGGLRLHLEGEIISRPYIQLTLQLMKDFGAEAEWVDDATIEVKYVPYRPMDFVVENDWSAASYWYEMVALSADTHAEVVLPGLYASSYQGDSAVARMFEPLGVCTRYDERKNRVTISKCERTVERMDYDFVNQPDLAQTLVVTCIMLGIPFRFTGLQSLKIKETDRMAALVCELGKLGFVLHEEADSILSWSGERCAPQGDVSIDTYEDHRMAMAFAPIAMVQGELVINNPQVVSKSYPGFWDDLKSVGFITEEGE